VAAGAVGGYSASSHQTVKWIWSKWAFEFVREAPASRPRPPESCPGSDVVDLVFVESERQGEAALYRVFVWFDTARPPPGAPASQHSIDVFVYIFTLVPIAHKFAEAGIAVRVMLDKGMAKKQDAKAALQILMDGGVHVHVLDGEGGLLHVKVALIDRKGFLFGSVLCFQNVSPIQGMCEAN
jgi:hypothetical protein